MVVWLPKETFNYKYIKNRFPYFPKFYKVLPAKQLSEKVVDICELIKDTENVVCATDKNETGQLLFYDLLMLAKALHKYDPEKTHLRRMWIHGWTAAAVRWGIENTVPFSFHEHLTLSALCRRYFDFVYWVNVTTLCSEIFASKQKYLIDCKRMTLPIISEMTSQYLEEKENSGAEEAYTLDLVYNFEGFPLVFRWTDDVNNFVYHKFSNKKDCSFANIDTNQHGIVVNKVVELESIKPGLPFNMMSLLQGLWEEYGYKPNESLIDIDLMAEQGYITNPRTDETTLPLELMDHVKNIITKRINEIGVEDLKESIDISTEALLKSGIFDSSKSIYGSHAIVPTNKPIIDIEMTNTQKAIYNYIANRLCSALLPDFVQHVVRIVVEYDDELYTASARSPFSLGWKLLSKYINFGVRFSLKAPPSDPVVENDDVTFEALNRLNIGEDIIFSDLKVNSFFDKPETKMDYNSFFNLLEKDNGVYKPVGTAGERAMLLSYLFKQQWLRLSNEDTFVPSKKAIRFIKVVQDTKIASMAFLREMETSINSIQTPKDAANFLNTMIDAMNADLLKFKDRKAYAYQDMLGYHADDDGLLGDNAVIHGVDCPRCGSHDGLRIGVYSFYCTEPRCNFLVPSSINEHNLNEGSLRTLINKGTISVGRGKKKVTITLQNGDASIKRPNDI